MLSTALIASMSSELQEKTAATPRIAASWMNSKNPILKRFGHGYAQAASSPTLSRLTQDTFESVSQGMPFGPKFYKNTVQGRLAQAALERSLPKTEKGKQLAAGATWFKRNFPGASAAGGFLPRLIG